MGARTRIPLWVLLPSLAVSVVAFGAIAAGVIGIAGARGDLIRQADSNLQACAAQMLSQGFVAGPTSGQAPPGACDTELLSASGQLLTPPAPARVPARPSRPGPRGWRRTRRGWPPCPAHPAQAGAFS